MPKSDQEFNEFRKDFRRYMSALLERLDTLTAALTNAPDAPTPTPAEPAPQPLPFPVALDRGDHRNSTT